MVISNVVLETIYTDTQVKGISETFSSRPRGKCPALGSVRYGKGIAEKISKECR